VKVRKTFYTETGGLAGISVDKRKSASVELLGHELRMAQFVLSISQLRSHENIAE
jgi:hypothetical protein